MYKYLLLILLLFSCHRQEKKEPKYEYLKIDTGTFDIGAEIFITEDIDLAAKFVSMSLGEHHEPAEFIARGVTFYKYGYQPIVWLPKRPESSEEIGVANHELMHLTLRVMEWADVELNESTEEVFTYEFQYISKQFYK